MITGVDVSGHQPTWSPQPADEFVIIKATEGRTYTSSHMAGQADAARAKGLVVGFYHFMWPGNPLEQAAYFVGKALIKPGDLLVCDWENTGGGTPTQADKDAFIAEVKRLRPKHRVGLYCNASMWNGSNKRAGDFLWVAHYGVSKPNVNEPWTFWQWTDNPIDQNHGQFATKATLRSWAEALQEDDMAAKVPFRGGWTCDCVKTSLPWVEADMIRRGIITHNIDIYQLGWRGDVAKSAGTHDEGGCTDVGQWSLAAIDVWRRWGWTQQRRDLTGVKTHGHGWPYGCSHLAPAAVAQARAWDNRRNGLVNNGPVAGRWPVKHWREAMEDGIMGMIDDIAEATADKVIARRGAIADAVATREMKLSAKALDAVADEVLARLLKTDDLASPSAWRKNHPEDTTWPGLQFWSYTHDGVYRTEGKVNEVLALLNAEEPPSAAPDLAALDEAERAATPPVSPSE